MLIAGWTLALLFGLGFVVIAVVCRKTLAQHFRGHGSDLESELADGIEREFVGSPEGWWKP